MKIAFVTKSRLIEKRGLAFAIVAKCLSYAHREQEVTLLSPKRSGQTLIDFWQYFQVKGSPFIISQLPCLELRANTLFEPLFLHFRYLFLSWSFSLNSLLYLKRNKFEVVHCYSECLELIFLFLLFKPFYSPKIVCEVHYETTSGYVKFIEKLVFGSIDLILTTTNNMANYCKKSGGDRNKIMVLPEGVDLNDFDYKSTKKSLRIKLKLPINKIIIGYAGRFETNGMEKGIPTLIESLPILNKHRKDFFLLCVGGPLELINKYQKRCMELNITSQTLFVDHVPPKVLYQFIRSFDICALPFPWTDHFAYNMSPLKMFEYMASKVPIIGTDLPSIKEILKTNVNSILIKPDDSKLLASTVLKMTKNKALVDRISKQAFKDVSQNYTWDIRAARILNFLSK